MTERFLDKLKITDANECWLWIAGCDDHGYGAFSVDRKRRKASRVAWVIVNGPIPDGMDVLHRCDNPPCCNPSHLFLGTHADNMKDMAAKGRHHDGSCLPRGDDHHSRRRPDLIARGDRHGSKTKPWKIPKGEKAFQAILSDEIVLICRLAHFRYKATQTKLAKRWGVTPQAMHNAIHGKTFKHLPKEIAQNGEL